MSITTTLGTLGRSRFHGSDQPTEEIRLTRRTLRPDPPRWSPRTQLVLAGLGVLTAILGTVLVVQVVGAQDLRADGREAATAVSEALDAARADVAALAAAVDEADSVAADARSLSDLLALRANDLSGEAVAGVAASADALAAELAEPVVEPSLPGAFGSPATLPDRYVSADRAELAELREQVEVQLERLPAIGEAADARAADLAAAQAAVAASAGVAVRAAEAAAPRILAAGPEAAADARARLEQAVAALVALGEAPEPGPATRDAFTAYFSAADGLRLSHEQAVAARLAAEQAAADAAAAAEEAARQTEEQPWWWGWWGGDGRDRG